MDMWVKSMFNSRTPQQHQATQNQGSDIVHRLLSLMLAALNAVLLLVSVQVFPWNQLVSIIFNRGTIKEPCSYACMCLMERGRAMRENT